MRQHNTAVAGELVGVDVQMSNPMAIGLNLTQLRAVYEHESGAVGLSNDFVKVLPLVCCTQLARDMHDLNATSSLRNHISHLVPTARCARMAYAGRHASLLCLPQLASLMPSGHEYDHRDSSRLATMWQQGKVHSKSCTGQVPTWRKARRNHAIKPGCPTLQYLSLLVSCVHT